jgi:hypothetical protein
MVTIPPQHRNGGTMPPCQRVSHFSEGWYLRHIGTSSTLRNAQISITGGDDFRRRVDEALRVIGTITKHSGWNWPAGSGRGCDGCGQLLVGWC